MKNIEHFCKETGFQLTDGEIGMSRPCIGIEDPKSDSFVAYAVFDEQWNIVKQHTAKTADDAYHKGPYLAVLKTPNGDALEQLDAWVGRIMEKGYRLESYLDRTATALFRGVKAIKLNAVIDP